MLFHWGAFIFWATGLAYESLLDINVQAASRPMHAAHEPPLNLKEAGRQVTPLVRRPQTWEAVQKSADGKR